MAMELGPYGITVNAVAPGMIESAMSKLMSDSYRKERIAKAPLRRLGSPDDIADAVVFLASSEASYITGEVLHVTGGVY